MKPRMLFTTLVLTGVLAIVAFFLFPLGEPAKIPATSSLKTTKKKLLDSFDSQSQAHKAPQLKTTEKKLLGIFESQSPTQTTPLSNSTDAWENWVEKETEALLKFALADFYKQRPSAQTLEPEQIEDMKASFRAQIAEHAARLKNERTDPPPISSSFKTIDKTPDLERYTGEQTVAAIMEKYDEGYTRFHKDTLADTKYPREKWLAMLLDRGITIETILDYQRYLQIRKDLAHLENNPGAWESWGHGAIAPTDDWETYKSAYTERKIWEAQQIQQAQRADPNVWDGMFGGTDRKTFLPMRHDTLYVKRRRTGASFHGALLRNKTQEFNLLFRGIEPEGYDVIYLDSNDNILSEPPPPITREELMNSGGAVLPEAWWEGDFSEQSLTEFQRDVPMQEMPENRSVEAPRFAADVQQEVKDQVEQAEEISERLLERLTQSDADFQEEFEKQFLPEVSDKGFENTLRKRFSPERFNAALQTLKRYGFKEGLRRLKESDPEAAAHLQRLMSPKEVTD